MTFSNIKTNFKEKIIFFTDKRFLFKKSIRSLLRGSKSFSKLVGCKLFSPSQRISLLSYRRWHRTALL